MAAPLNATVTGIALVSDGLVAEYNAGVFSLEGLALVTFGFLTPMSQVWTECSGVSTSWNDCSGVVTSWQDC